MTRQQKEEAILRSYDAVRFDERTSDERGFAARFESEFKPLLRANIGFNLGVLSARRRRRNIARAVVLLTAAYYAGLFLFLGKYAMKVPDSQEGLFETFIMPAFLCFAVYGWAILKRPGEADPNQTAIVGTIIDSFGYDFRTAAARPDVTASPILPPHSRFVVLPDHLSGRLGVGRFLAFRVKALQRERIQLITTTFRGWYLRVDPAFSFSGITIIHERHGEARLRKGLRLQEVALEDPEFARRFVVLSTDQVEARVILAPDVMRHLTVEADRIERERAGRASAGSLMLAFSGPLAHVWLPTGDTALANWQPLDPPAMIEGIHGAFAELAGIRGFLRDIDVIAESEGFRLQASKSAVI